MAPSKLSLKLLIDKKGEKVLFAEAGKDFVDFLFSLLTLPIGTILSLVDMKDMAGGLPMIYQSVSNLDDEFIISDQKKDVLLKPTSTLPFVPSQVPLLPIKEWLTSSSKPSGTSLHIPAVTLNRESPQFPPRTFSAFASKSQVVDTQRGFVRGLVTYMVADDLGVSPISTITNISLLNKFNIKDLGALEEKIVQIGMDEGLELLRHSLNSKTVLTNVFLGDVASKAKNLQEV